MNETQNQPTVPDEIRGWNWGAFLLNWIWGLGNNTFIALLMFVPVVNLAMPFVLGAKGNAWAWKNAKWDDVDHFRRVQRTWTLVGLGLWVGLITFFAVILWGITSFMHSSEPFQNSLAMVRDNPRVVQALGTPIEPAYLVNGNIDYDGNSGFAELNYDITGPKGEATVYLDAEQEHGRWRFYSLVVVTPSTDIVLANDRPN